MTNQFLLLNRVPGMAWDQGRPDSITRAGFADIRAAFPDPTGGHLRVGVSFIFSYFNTASDATLAAALRRFLQLAVETDTPVLVQLDGENWWDARPDLWNWWDPALPGFDPANRENVEWSGWTPAHALKLAWRNWGQQFRVRPPPNLMGARYRREWHAKMSPLVSIVRDWWRALPPEKRDLFVGLKLGWESSIGVNAWYYPDGNALLDRPESADPCTGLTAGLLPGRGVTPIGYNAVRTAGLRDSGDLTEGDLAEIPRRHLEDLCRTARELGLPREKIFTHGAGWKDGELLYHAAVNAHSCPGWSFYRHAPDPRRDTGVQAALARSDAPVWAATEWMLEGRRTADEWRQALNHTLADPRCRYLCLFNWEGICDTPAAINGIRALLAAPTA